MSMRPLGALTTQDLGMQVSGPNANGDTVRGSITSIRHFRSSAGEAVTSLIVKIPVAPKDQRDHAEILCPAIELVDVTGPANGGKP